MIYYIILAYLPKNVYLYRVISKGRKGDEEYAEKWVGGAGGCKLEYFRTVVEATHRGVGADGRDTTGEGAATDSGALRLRALWDRHYQSLSPIISNDQAGR